MKDDLQLIYLTYFKEEDQYHTVVKDGISCQEKVDNPEELVCITPTYTRAKQIINNIEREGIFETYKTTLGEFPMKLTRIKKR